METINSVITTPDLAQAYSYEAYRNLADSLLAEHKTTGTNHSEDMLGYTKMNIQRMGRLDRTTQINTELSELLTKVEEKWVWLIITEAWCGDAAQNIPVIQKMAELSPNIEVKLILRDENLHIMDEYLTNGGRSIPKLIALKAETLEEIGTWGPRPQTAQGMVTDFKENPNGREYKDFVVDVQKWYAKDKTQSVQNEFITLVKEWMKL